MDDLPGDGLLARDPTSCLSFLAWWIEIQWLVLLQSGIFFVYVMLFFALYVTYETHNSLFDLSKDFFHPGHKAAHPREHSRSVPVAQIFSISRKGPKMCQVLVELFSLEMLRAV